MFADDINLFYSHRNIKTLFTTVNEELNRIGQWFKANKLSLNFKKIKYTFFHKNSSKGDISLKLAKLKIANKTIERKKSINLLGIMLHENISWRIHICTNRKIAWGNTHLTKLNKTHAQ